MRPIAPRIAGADEVQVGLNGEDFREIVVAIGETENGNPAAVTRWRPDAEERQQLLNGADIFIIFIGPRMPPMQVHVGWPYGELER